MLKLIKKTIGRGVEYTASRALSLCFMVVFFVCPTSLYAADKVYEKPSAFLKRHFKKIPKTKVYTLTAVDQKKLRSILGHAYKQKKVRYWSDGRKLGVILNEIGKTEPITVGFLIKGGKIAELKVLIYRESHGSEVSRPFFTKQFVGAKLNGEKLTKKIDGIVGSTLSVRALEKLSVTSLYLSTKLGK